MNIWLLKGLILGDNKNKMRKKNLRIWYPAFCFNQTKTIWIAGVEEEKETKSYQTVKNVAYLNLTSLPELHLSTLTVLTCDPISGESPRSPLVAEQLYFQQKEHVSYHEYQVHWNKVFRLSEVLNSSMKKDSLWAWRSVALLLKVIRYSILWQPDISTKVSAWGHWFKTL